MIMSNIGIYKITNLINNKSYIGQSVDINKRWRSEIQNAFNSNTNSYDYPLSRAIRKYGLDNFSFEIIERCERKQLNEREKYWIAYYDTYYNGYNQTLGGDTVLHMCKLTPEQALEIIEILAKDSKGEVNHKKLASMYNVSRDTIQGINAGRLWYNDKYTYPLHISKYNYFLKEKKKKICIDCGKPISHGATRCSSCDLNYRREQSLKQMPVTKNELEQLLLENKGNFTKVSKMFQISDNGLRKWCKKLGLPFHSSEYRK